MPERIELMNTLILFSTFTPSLDFTVNVFLGHHTQISRAEHLCTSVATQRCPQQAVTHMQPVMTPVDPAFSFSHADPCSQQHENHKVVLMLWLIDATFPD